MKDYRDLWEWECEAYKGRKLNPYRLTYLLVVIVWAILIATLLLTTEKPVQEPAAETEPAEEIQIEPVILIVEKPEEPVEEPEDHIDLEKLRQIENATITAYCICKKCCGKDESHPAYGITASGRPAEPYVSVAVDPFLIPLGSTVYLDYGDGVLQEFRADDTGGSVNGAHIDVCMTTHEEALEHGVREARVYWKEEQSWETE